MITVIIPAFNAAKTLLQTVGSVLSQSYDDFEIIIVDDCSTDDTAESVKNNFSQSNILYYRLEKNLGVHSARNVGIDLAQGDFLVFLDADDQIFPNAFAEAMKIFTSHDDVGMISAPFQTSDGELTSFNISESGYISFEQLLCQKNVKRYKNGFSIIKKEVVGDSRFVMQNLDFIFYRKIAKKTNMYFIAKPLGIYNLQLNNNSSLTAKRKIPNINLSIKRSEALVDFLDEFGSDLIKLCPARYASYAYGAAVGLLLDFKKVKAIKFAFLVRKFNHKKNLFFIFSLLPLSPLLLRLLFLLKKFFIKYKQGH